MLAVTACKLGIQLYTSSSEKNQNNCFQTIDEVDH